MAESEVHEAGNMAINALVKENATLRERLEEAVWLLNHDSGDIGSVGRKRWIERRDALFAALAARESET